MSEIKDKRKAQRLYEKEYNRLYRAYKKLSPFMGKYNHSSLIVEPTPLQFTGTDPQEPIICSHFGCKTHLSPTEALYSPKCVAHQSQNQKPIYR